MGTGSSSSDFISFPLRLTAPVSAKPMQSPTIAPTAFLFTCSGLRHASGAMTQLTMSSSHTFSRLCSLTLSSKLSSAPLDTAFLLPVDLRPFSVLVAFALSGSLTS